MSETKPENKQVDAKPSVTADVDLLRKIDMLEAQLKVRETQLRQAIDIATRANDEKTAKDEAEKLRLIDSISMDSHFAKDELKEKTLPELQTMRLTLDKSIEQTFVSVAAQMDEAKRKKAPLLTVGAIDTASKKWTGGL